MTQEKIADRIRKLMELSKEHGAVVSFMLPPDGLAIAIAVGPSPSSNMIDNASLPPKGRV